MSLSKHIFFFYFIPKSEAKAKKASNEHYYSKSMRSVGAALIIYMIFRCFLSKKKDETPKAEPPPLSDYNHHPQKHFIEDLDTKTEVILAAAVAVLVVFIVTW